MSQVLVNFRMDEEDKKGMEEVCKELGLSMTTAFTLLAKKMRRERCGLREETANLPPSFFVRPCRSQLEL